MPTISIPIVGVVFLALCLNTVARAECTANSLVVVINKANPTEGLSMAQLRRLLLGDLRNWPDKKQVFLITPDPQSEAFKCVLSTVVRMTSAEYRRYIANAEFRGEEPLQLRTVAPGSAAAKAVSSTPGSIAILEAGTLPSIAASVRVLRINGQHPGGPGYPL